MLCFCFSNQPTVDTMRPFWHFIILYLYYFIPISAFCQDFFHLFDRVSKIYRESYVNFGIVSQKLRTKPMKAPFLSVLILFFIL